jgi:soluble lytic murein transglycosylase-like protein
MVGNMRIDFGASYKEVSRLLRASTSPAGPKSPGDFEKAMQSTQAKEAQQAVINQNSSAIPSRYRSEANDQLDMRASFKTSEPTMELPQLQPQMTELPAPVPPANEQLTPSQSVKTPTLVDVRKVEMAGVPSLNPPLSKENIRAMLSDVGKKFGVNPNLAMAVVKAESAFNPKAVSSDGHASKGLFQLLDSTGRGLLARGDNPERKYDPFDPAQNVELGTSYLKYLHSIFSTPTSLPNNHETVPAKNSDSLERFAVAAFNAGEGRVAAAQKRAERAGKDPSNYEHVEPYLPKITQTYVGRVVNGKSQV